MDISKIGKAIGKATDDAKTGLKWADKTFFTHGAAKNDDSISKVLVGEHAISIKKPIVAGVVAAGAVGTIGYSSLESRNMASMGGRIDAGEGLSNMTGSVALSPNIQKMQKGKYVKFENSFDNAGADGDLVFAMHRMR